MQAGGNSDMTLAFELAALKRLDEPDAVFTDARQWTKYVGVISEKPTYVVTNYTRKHRVRQDFFSGPRGVTESLENVREQFDTDRYVFVGTTDTDRERAEATGWEYIDVTAAVEAAGWSLAADTAPEIQIDPEDEADDGDADDPDTATASRGDPDVDVGDADGRSDTIDPDVPATSEERRDE